MGMGKDFGRLFSFGSQLRFIILSVVIGLFSLNSQTVEASGAWGGSLGGFGSGGSGGAWGGSLLGGRTPVRNLLGRLNSRVSNIGGGSVGSSVGSHWGSSGSSGSSVGSVGSHWGSSGGSGGSSGGGLLSRSGGGLFGFGLLNGGLANKVFGGRFGSSGGSSGGFVGGSSGGFVSTHGSSGSSFASSGSVGSTYVAPTYSTPIYSSPIYSSPTYSTPIYSAPIHSSPILSSSSYALPTYDQTIVSQLGNCFGNCFVEESYPVGDYGFQPGYPVESSMMGGISGIPIGSPIGMGVPMMDGGMLGSPISQGIMGESQTISSPILDGGSIDSMLDNGGIPLEPGLSVEPTPANQYYPPAQGSGAPNTNPNLPGPASDDDQTYLDSPTDSKAVLNLKLPSEADVYINGKLTRTPGAFRSFVSKRLTENRDYKYQVKAVLVKDGKKIIRSRLVTMRPGVNQTVELDFEKAQTTLALRVPANAKVILCGKETSQTGSMREFTTTSLPEGETWENYLVSVEYSVDGEKKTEQRKLNLNAGETRQLEIGLEKTVDRVASR